MAEERELIYVYGSARVTCTRIVFTVPVEGAGYTMDEAQDDALDGVETDVQNDPTSILGLAGVMVSEISVREIEPVEGSWEEQ